MSLQLMWRVCERAGLQGAPEALAVTAGRVGWRHGMVGVGELGAGETAKTPGCTPAKRPISTGTK